MNGSCRHRSASWRPPGGGPEAKMNQAHTHTRTHARKHARTRTRKGKHAGVLAHARTHSLIFFIFFYTGIWTFCLTLGNGTWVMCGVEMYLRLAGDTGLKAVSFTMAPANAHGICRQCAPCMLNLELRPFMTWTAQPWHRALGGVTYWVGVCFVYYSVVKYCELFLKCGLLSLLTFWNQCATNTTQHYP